MKLLDLTMVTPEENLALDEYLVQYCREAGGVNCLRFWEPTQYFVVLGYGNNVESEVYVEECNKLRIPIFRRVSGGGCVLQGPGCLNYTLAMKIDSHPSLATIPSTNRFVMEKNRQAIARIVGNNVYVRGTTDLTLGELKFSGNAQRRYEDYILYHGTFLLNFDISMMEKTLKIPTRQPLYRHGRAHREFVINLNVLPQKVKETLSQEWGADEIVQEFDTSKVVLLAQKYLAEEWNFKI